MAPTLQYACSQGSPQYFTQTSNMKNKPKKTKKNVGEWVKLRKNRDQCNEQEKTSGGKKLNFRKMDK